MAKKAQAALEYLMTYGWALVLVATVVTILLIASSPLVSASSFSSSDPKIMVKGSSYTDGMVKIKLQNLTGGEINITNLAEQEYYNCKINGEYILPTGLKIGAGGEILVECKAEAAETNAFEINYTDQTKLEKSVIISGMVKKEAVKTISSCPYIISEEGAYALASSIQANSSKCISVEADNVTINCRNNSISCTGECSGFTKPAVEAIGRKNITVANCAITGFGIGVYLSGSTESRISGNEIKECTYGTYIRNSSSNSIKNNLFQDNTNYGIHLFGSENNTISYNTGSNTGFGIYAAFNSNDNTITYNNMSNGTVGIYTATARNTISYNTACGNTGMWGDIFCGGETEQVTGTENTGLVKRNACTEVECNLQNGLDCPS